MDLVSPVVVLLVIGFALIALIASLPTGQKNEFIAKSLMTERERKAIVVIERLHPHARVHAQVAMGALMEVDSRVDKRKQQGLRNRYNRKIVDFILEDRSNGKVIALVELDDRTHNVAKDKARDAITSSAGYETIRIPAKTKLNEENLAPFFTKTSAPCGTYVSAGTTNFGGSTRNFGTKAA